jgi:4-amino-4-deoxy-L-arabinose transferase-like glycosyltransferase
MASSKGALSSRWEVDQKNWREAKGMKAEDTLSLLKEEKTDEEQTTPSTQLWQSIALGTLLLISAFLNFFQISQIGYGNAYYAAAVKSMLQSWHTFLFVSFDPGGFVSVDKPPLGFWLQTASAKTFGFSGWSILLPEAVAGIFSVIVLYLLVRRIWGPLAGLLAALALALSPISMVMNRSNNMDGLLVLTVLLAAWMACRATESGRLRWLLLCALMVGLGFQIKTLEAYLVVPALSLVYLLGAPLPWRRRIWHLSVALALLLVLSFAWITMVDLTPTSQRPYVGSSQTNAEIELTFGYNGLDRLLGYKSANPDSSSSRSTSSVTSENGVPGIFRLFNQQLGSQVGWLLPLALLGLVVAAWQTKRRWPLDRCQQSLVLWGMWLLIMGVFFSVANFYHPYYLTMLAPAICALSSIGVLALWRDYRRPGWRGWLLPSALVATAVVQAMILSSFSVWSAWITPIVVGWCLIAALILTVARLELPLGIPAPFRVLALMLGMFTLLIAPIVWDAVTLQQVPNAAFPLAGPRSSHASIMPFTPPGTSSPDGSDDTELEQYLLHNQGKTPYLLATLNATTAASFILETGQPVMALGGYSGSDPILTQPHLSELVSHSIVRFFLLPDLVDTSRLPDDPPPPLRKMLESGDVSGTMGRNGQLVQWVQQSCVVVAHNRWQSLSQQFQSPSHNGQELYDCLAQQQPHKDTNSVQKP